MNFAPAFLSEWNIIKNGDRGNMEQDLFYDSIAAYFDLIFPLTGKQIDFCASEFGQLDNLYFLDAGCSTGKFANELGKKGALGIGIDSNGEMIRLAREKYSSASLTFKKMDLLRVQEVFPANYLDGIICFGNTLSYLNSQDEIKKFLKLCFSVLKPGGKLLVQILNYDYVFYNKVPELPPIENEQVRFVQNYVLASEGAKKIMLETELLVKTDNQTFSNSVLLTPICRAEFEKMLLLTGFTDACFYAGFDKAPFSGKHLPLIVSARK